MNHLPAQVDPLPLRHACRQWSRAEENGHEFPPSLQERCTDLLRYELGIFTFATPAQHKNRGVFHGPDDLVVPAIPGPERCHVQKHGVIRGHAQQPSQRLNQRLIVPAVGHEDLRFLPPCHSALNCTRGASTPNRSNNSAHSSGSGGNTIQTNEGRKTMRLSSITRAATSRNRR